MKTTGLAIVIGFAMSTSIPAEASSAFGNIWERNSANETRSYSIDHEPLYRDTHQNQRALEERLDRIESRQAPIIPTTKPYEIIKTPGAYPGPAYYWDGQQYQRAY